MNNVIIGTAGHVDHGKTCLINALTGIDTDRLEEEKRRGITIELGFAYLNLPDGGRAGIIDGPGHERFIRNMLAGAGGIDLAVLVVAADEGVMPQTREHLGILSLLEIKRGLVAVTKTDLVEPDWLEMMLEDLREELKGSFLEDAPVIPVSSYTGEGIETLRQALFALVAETGGKNMEKPFRVPVDRVFSMQGFGTVVTGTLIEGTLREGQEVMLYPEGKKTRVRSLQVHSKNVPEAWAGQRVAVNLLNMKKEELRRGLVLAEPGSLRPSMMLDVTLRVLPDSQRTVKDSGRLHFYHGAEELLCKAVLLGGVQELLPGQECYAQLRFEEEIAVKAGDHFVVRFYSPIETIGGGTVLDPCPLKHRRGSEEAVEKLRLLHGGSEADRVEAVLREHSSRYGELPALRLQTGLSPEAFQEALGALTKEGRAVPLTEKVYLHRSALERLCEKARAALAQYHEANPLRAGMKREELRGRLFPRVEAALADRAMERVAAEGAIACANNLCALPGFKVQFTPQQEKMLHTLRERYALSPFCPPERSRLSEEYGRDKNFQKALEYLLDTGELTPVDGELLFPASAVEEALARFTALARENGAVTLAQFRDAIDASRKYAMALLEYWDRRGVTRKQEDARILL